jgi:tRNA 2-thiocytidine biosynthesis protein TtcA
MNEIERLERELAHLMGRCIADFRLIDEGDRIMVCASGGKDSYALLQILEKLRRKAPVTFELVVVHLDQCHPGHDSAPLEAWMKARGFTTHILRENTHDIVTSKIPAGKTYCSLCSRLRRGILYRAAQELGCNKLALGHHREDTIETLLLNLIFEGSLKAMPPKLISDDRRHIVIRPLLYVSEELLSRYAKAMAFPILPCGLCGTPQAAPKRAEVKQWLAQLECIAPGAKESLLAATKNVRPTHLLDQRLWSQAEGEDETVHGGK